MQCCRTRPAVMFGRGKSKSMKAIEWASSAMARRLGLDCKISGRFKNQLGKLPFSLDIESFPMFVPGPSICGPTNLGVSVVFHGKGHSLSLEIYKRRKRTSGFTLTLWESQILIPWLWNSKGLQTKCGVQDYIRRSVWSRWWIFWRDVWIQLFSLDFVGARCLSIWKYFYFHGTWKTCIYIYIR